jgi:molybdopterin-guanine dinucleotide biosynthesis adapter protein
MKIVAVVGTKNTGKTTLVTRIIRELVDRGFKVGTIKHSHHRFDMSDRDTGKHKMAGAEIVAGIGEETFFTMTGGMDLEKVLNMMNFIENLDYVILEGFKTSEYAKISTNDFKDEYTIANVNPMEINDPEFKSLVDRLEGRSYGIIQNLNCKKCGFEDCEDFVNAKIKGNNVSNICKTESDEVLMKIDDHMIPLNPFVRSFVKETILGMVKSLKTEEFGVNEFEKIELLIRDDHDRQ